VTGTLEVVVWPLLKALAEAGSGVSIFDIIPPSEASFSTEKRFGVNAKDYKRNENNLVSFLT
jgi:hypothetical protein